MDEPDIQKLATETQWPIHCWADAWAIVRQNISTNQQEAVWYCVIQLCYWQRPDHLAIELVKVMGA